MDRQRQLLGLMPTHPAGRASRATGCGPGVEPVSGGPDGAYEAVGVDQVGVRAIVRGSVEMLTDEREAQVAGEAAGAVASPAGSVGDRGTRVSSTTAQDSSLSSQPALREPFLPSGGINEHR